MPASQLFIAPIEGQVGSLPCPSAALTVQELPSLQEGEALSLIFFKNSYLFILAVLALKTSAVSELSRSMGSSS